MDIINQENPVATIQVPLLTGLRQQLTKSLLQGESYYSLMKYWPAMEEDAAKLPEYLLNQITQRNRERNKVAEDAGQSRPWPFETRTEEYLKTLMRGNSRLFEVYHAIPRQLLQSLILGTVAWDYHPSRGSSRQKYDSKTDIGIYALGVAVKARQGAWLTANEIGAMIGHMQEYVAGYDAWTVHQGQPTTPRDVQLAEFVTKIDTQHGTHDTPTLGPRFCGTASQKRGLQDLIKSLGERMRASLLLDPQGTTPMVQSPLYIGCSVVLENWTRAHDPQVGKTSAMTQSNKLLAMMLSLMKYQGLESETTVVTVLHLWKKQDLDFSETLICSLAQSMACQSGCNMVECGDAKGKGKSDSACEDYVKARVSYLHDNITLSIRDAEARQAFLDHFANFEPLFDGQETELNTKVDQIVGELQDMIRGMQTLAKEMDRAKNAYQERRRQLDGNVSLLGNLAELLRGLQL